MKRDMDLVRKILFKMEDDEAQVPVTIELLPEIDGYREDQIFYHIRIMAQAGLIHVDTVVIPTTENQSYTYNSYSLSWNGHEFLDAARDNKRWEKAKTAMTQAGGFALDIMKQLLITYLKAELKLP